MMRTILARLIDSALNAYAPITHLRSAAAYTDQAGADLLADLEADTEVWEPRQPPRP